MNKFLIHANFKRKLNFILLWIIFQEFMCVLSTIEFEKRMVSREASHAGSWYTDNAKDLAKELDQWLHSCGIPKLSNARAIIAPHAGYQYSGRCAAYAFANIDPQWIQRVFILGPSHHHFTRKCALSIASIYKTPFGNLPIDNEVYEELRATNKFEDMDLSIDEAEHSLEMHLPFLAKIFNGASVKIVPIMVGACTPETEAIYGRILAKYIDDPTTFFSISSDFCHWGARFGYQYYEKKRGPIHKSIEALDHSGMEIIESGSPDAFQEYLSEYENTICGRHPIGVFLHMLKHCATGMRIQFLQYEQSSQCKSMRDSSVSYASAVVTALQ